MRSDLTFGPSFKAKRGYLNIKVLTIPLLLVLYVWDVKSTIIFFNFGHSLENTEMENVVILENRERWNNFGQILDPLGTKDYPSTMSEKFRLFLIEATILNFDRNKQCHLSRKL